MSREPIAVGMAEAQRITGHSRDQLMAAVSAGDLGVIKNGTRYVFRVAELDRWLASREVKTTGDVR